MTEISFDSFGDLLRGFQDVEYLPSRASFFTTFLKNCGRGESLRTTTCLKAVVGVSKGMLPVKYVPIKPLFVSVEFHRDHKTVTKVRCIWPPSVLGILPDLKQWCMSVSKVTIQALPSFTDLLLGS